MLKIKVCGMTDPVNVRLVSELRPDYMGFILYRNSPRYVDEDRLPGLLSSVPWGIMKTGVIVNEPIGEACRIARSGLFDLLQLHGDESPDYCSILSQHVMLIKAFRISTSLPADIEDYMPYCRMFLFDTAGKNYGGTGHKFNHNILTGYPLEKDFILSGGISAEDADRIRAMVIPGMATVDLNSRFEHVPGIKDVSLLKQFIDKIRSN